jgi:hypothetical protein
MISCGAWAGQWGHSNGLTGCACTTYRAPKGALFFYEWTFSLAVPNKIRAQAAWIDAKGSFSFERLTAQCAGEAEVSEYVF